VVASKLHQEHLFLSIYTFLRVSFLLAAIGMMYFWKVLLALLLITCESDSSHVPRSVSSLSQFGCGEEHGFA
jgi:hypothetical protein